MARTAQAGEMRTRIRVQRLTAGIDADGYPTEQWTDVFTTPAWCKWVNAHGSEVYENLRLDLQETATLPLRHTDKIHERCRVVRVDDGRIYDIVSLNPVEDRRAFLEIQVKRTVKA